MNSEEQVTTFVTTPIGYICISIDEYRTLIHDYAIASCNYANLLIENRDKCRDLSAADAELDGYRRFFAQDSYSKGKYEDFIHYGSKPIDPVEKEGF